MKAYFFLFALAVLIISCEDEQQMQYEGLDFGALQLEQAKPKAGENIKFRYMPVKDATNKPQAIVNFLVNGKSYPKDVKLKESDSVFTGNIKTPDSAQALSFSFMYGNYSKNNGSKAYVLPLYDKYGQQVKGSNAAIGTYFLRDGYNLKTAKDSALNLISLDLKNQPDLRKHYDQIYPKILYETDKDSASRYITDRITYYQQKEKLTENDLDILNGLYHLQKDKKKSDSINRLALESYPEGKAAKIRLQNKFLLAGSLREKQAVVEAYENKIGQTGEYYDFMLSSLSLAHASTGDMEAFHFFAEKISNPMIQAEVFNSVALNLVEEGKELTEAGELAFNAIVLIKSLLNGMTNKPLSYSQKHYDELLKSSLSAYRDTYAMIHYKQGNLKKATELQKQAVEEFSSFEANERYIKYLLERGHYGEAQKVAENFVKDNRATQEIKTDLKSAYRTNKKPMEDFEAYLSSLEKHAEKETGEKIKSDSLEITAPAMSLTDFDRDQVDLSALKAEIVVLTFWSLSSDSSIHLLPAMQQLAERFEENPNIKFLFINTLESSETREKDIKNLLANNFLAFNVMLDQPTESDGENFETANAFDIHEVPTLVVIGPDGNIRFRKADYSGNNQLMVKEIEMMINLLRANYLN